MSKISQKQQILEYLQKGNTLTGLQGLTIFGSLSIRNRIGELRKQGYNIQGRTIYNEKTKKHYSEYFLSDEPPDTEQETAIRHANEITEQAIAERAAEPHYKEKRGQLAFI